MNFEDIKSQRIGDLEAEYSLASAEKDQEKMDNIVGDLMAYNAIDKSDSRIKSLKKRKVQKFYRDYRTETSFTTKWVMGNAPYNMKATLHAQAHEGKRIEGVYEGTVTIKARDMVLDIREIKNTGAVVKLRDNIRNLDKRCNRAPLNMGTNFESRILNGEYAAYTITVAQGQNFLKSDMGYAFLARIDNTIKITVVLDTQALETCHVDVTSARRIISSAMKKEVESLNTNCKIVVKVIGEPSKNE